MDQWRPFLPCMDIANLWVWKYQDLPRLRGHVDRCAEVFPGKEIVVGCYIRDCPAQEGVPLDPMRGQFETLPDLKERGRITGYSILAGCLIDMHPPQAEFIRDSINKHS